MVFQMLVLFQTVFYLVEECVKIVAGCRDVSLRRGSSQSLDKCRCVPALSAAPDAASPDCRC